MERSRPEQCWDGGVDKSRTVLAYRLEVIMIGSHIEIILIVTGALTAVAILQFIAPAPMLRTICGEAPKDAASIALARH